MSLPEIDDHEGRNLEMKFSNSDDRELIRELVRRGRLHIVDYSVLYWTEFAGNDDYMGSITHQTAKAITQNLMDKGHIIHHDSPSPVNEKQTVRRSSLVVLRERGVKPDGL
jgi:hypothetical protein